MLPHSEILYTEFRFGKKKHCYGINGDIDRHFELRYQNLHWEKNCRVGDDMICLQ